MTRDRISTSRCGDVVRYVLRGTSPHGGESDKYIEAINVFLDFEHCLPTEAEYHLFQLLEKVLEEATGIENIIAAYGEGATAEVREALRNPSDPEVQCHALEILQRRVTEIAAFYELAQKIKNVTTNYLFCKP